MTGIGIHRKSMAFPGGTDPGRRREEGQPLAGCPLLRQKAFAAVILVLILLLGSPALSAGAAEKDVIPDVPWQEKGEIIDGPDGVPLAFLLSGKRFTASGFFEETPFWESEEGWLVQDFITGDLTGSGELCVLLLVWKQGSYGKHRPFWVLEDSEEYSQHLFFYRVLDGKELRPAWMSSDVGRRIDRIFPDREKKQVVITSGDEAFGLSWEGFGFRLLGKREVPETGSEELWRIAAFGDLIAHRKVIELGEKAEVGYASLFQPVESLAQAADTALFVQETPFSRDGKYRDYPFFATPPEICKAAAGAGFDACSLATNHMLDEGASGAAYTAETIRGYGLAAPGVRCGPGDGTEVLSANGHRISLLSFTYGVNGGGETGPVCALDDDALPAVRRAADDSDLCVVIAHWGIENVSEITEEQNTWAQALADAGADLIIGSHPHVLQPWRILSGKDGRPVLAAFSLGNFLSAQWEVSHLIGACLAAEFSEGEEGMTLRSFSFVPVLTWQEKDRVCALPLQDAAEESLRRHARLGAVENMTKEQLYDIFFSGISRGETADAAAEDNQNDGSKR